ncbi:hypothetical protein FOA52_011858 [Chlamydomonas sp. UWO 241]|nr:hypothetical protein FOA52_011858 [Chlamydomonas sp. UWO 241]
MTQINGTFWHTQAEKYHDIIEVDKVYVFSKFQVKVANKAYASVANDYEIHFSDKTEVTEAADQEASGMTAALDLVPFDELLKHVTRKAPVDVIGVVIGLGPMGSIKRKSSGDEVSKRDVTIVDNGGKSISLTLWNETATRESLALEDWETRCVVLQITNCKVSDFQGCSLSSLSKSKMTVDPETDAARTLKNWWDALTTSERAGFPTVGDASARGSGAGRESRALSYLSAVADAAKESDLPSPDVKPSYHDVVASASLIKTDQTLYYMAHPETGRKVVEQSNGSFISESDGKVCDKPQPRYVFQFKLVDATGEVWTNIFGGEAEALLGCTADELVAQKSESEESVEARIKAAQWNEWAITVSSRTRDYNGERKMRHTVMALKPVDYAKESRRLLDLISRY